MSVKRRFIALFTVIVSLFLAVTCYADENMALSQIYTWDKYADVFLTQAMNGESLSCKVSNQTAEVVDSGLLADKGVTVKTTILIDSSTSVPSEMRERIKDYINQIIGDKSENEQYKIVSFGIDTTVLQDFTSDRYDLAVAAEKIEFTQNQSRIYDAIYNTIPEVGVADGEPYYYRTIVITDGADVSSGGITVEEVFLKLQQYTYPINVLEVSKEPKKEPDKNLSAITRISGGNHALFMPDTDLNSIEAAFSTDNIFWVRIAVPDTLLDGSIRQFDISDGMGGIQVDSKVPVFGSPEISVGQTEPDISGENVDDLEEQTEETTAAITTAPQSEGSGSADYTMLIIIAAAVVVLIAVVLVVVLIVTKSKGKKQVASIDKHINTNQPISSDKTEFLNGIDFEEVSGNNSAGTSRIRLHNANAPAQVWNVELNGSVMIGRETGCQICIEEKSISRQQCRIYKDAGGSILVENISHSNITLLNGEPLSFARKIVDGDQLRCGRLTLVVDSLHGGSAGGSDDINKLTQFVSV